MKDFNKQYLYAKEYRNKLYLKYYDKLSGTYGKKVITDIESELDMYYVNENDRCNTYDTLDGYKVDKYSCKNIKDYKGVLKEFKDSKIDTFGVEKIETQYIYKNFDVQAQNLDFEIPRICMFDIEILFYGTRVDIERAENDVTLITGYNITTNEAFAWGHKENLTNKFDYYVHFDNEKDMLRAFYKYVAKNVDILVAHNGSAFDFPYIHFRGETLNINPKSMSPFGIVTTKEKFSKFGKYTAVDIMGVSQNDSIDMLKRFVAPLSSYKLHMVAKEILGDEFGKIDYSDEGTLNNLYYNNYAKYVEYGYRDSLILKQVNDKLNLMRNAIALAYETSVNFEDFTATVAPYQNLFYNILNLIEDGLIKMDEL